MDIKLLDYDTYMRTCIFYSMAYFFSFTRAFAPKFSRDMSKLVPKLSSLCTIMDVDGKERLISYADYSTASMTSVPIVLLMGTAQTLSTYSVHVNHFSKVGRFIIPELRCQGETELLSSYGTIAQHVEDFEEFMKKIGLDRCRLAGFSFGGRVALAVAAHKPHLVEKLSITGVPLFRDGLGKMVIQSWQETLKEGDLRGAAWSFLLNGCSHGFIEKHADKFPAFVDTVVKSNDPKKLYDIMALSHIEDPCDPFSLESCSSRVTCKVQIIGATEDRIASVEGVRSLAKRIPNGMYVEIENVGHLIPFENPKLWRSHLIEFFS